MKTTLQLQLLQMYDLFRQQGADEEVISALNSSIDINELLKSLISIWTKYYTPEDIMGLLQFYQMPAGKKMVQVAPLVQKETEMVVQQLIQDSIQ